MAWGDWFIGGELAHDTLDFGVPHSFLPSDLLSDADGRFTTLSNLGFEWRQTLELFGDGGATPSPFDVADNGSFLIVDTPFALGDEGLGGDVTLTMLLAQEGGPLAIDAGAEQGLGDTGLARGDRAIRALDDLLGWQQDWGNFVLSVG